LGFIFFYWVNFKLVKTSADNIGLA